MAVNKCRDMLSDGVMGRNNGTTRIDGLMDFREEVENGGVGMRDMKEGDILGGRTIEGACILKEDKNGLVVSVSRVVRKKKTISGRVRQLSVSLGKIIVPVEDHSGIALVCWKDKVVGIGPEGVKGLKRLGCYWWGGIW